jgi:hypothetical protein
MSQTYIDPFKREEIQRACILLHCTPKSLWDAMNTVGTRLLDVEAYLKDKMGKKDEPPYPNS